MYFYSFHLHGDNIVECERAVDLIRQALADTTLNFRGPYPQTHARRFAPCS
jgi:hypothetical protein